MPATQELLDSLRPNSGQLIYDLVQQAGVNVAHWGKDRFDRAIDPHTNTYKNSQWTFGGGADPWVACIWWNELELIDGLIVREGNSKGDSRDWMNRIAARQQSREVGDRLRPKIKKAGAFDRLMSEAFLRRLLVRVVVLDGNRATADQAEFESSVASKRKLDAADWFVHSYDVYTGQYRLVREVPPPVAVLPDPFEDAEDPGLAPDFQEFLDDPRLGETEKEALIRLRVGQGWFRDALIKRWGGCAVTECKDSSLLVASHIKPWSKCTTRAERLSPDNGLLLTPNLDKLFDQGLITFTDNFKVVISPKLSTGNQIYFHVDRNLKLRLRNFHTMRPFMKWHREELFQEA